MNGRGVLTLLLRRFTLRHWFGAPRQTALSVLILALGIAVFFAIRLANRAAVSSFQNFTSLIAQESDWQIAAPGGPLPTTVLGEIRAALGAEAVEMIPVLESTAALPRQQAEEQIGSRRAFQLLGLDLIAVQNAAAANEATTGWFDQLPEEQRAGRNGFWDILQRTNAVFISTALARELKLSAGGTFPVVIADRVVPLYIGGVIPESPGRPAAPENLLIMDLPALQALTQCEGKVDRIEFILPDSPQREAKRTELRGVLEKIAAGRWEIASNADRQASAATMTRAFRMNLNILSLVGLLVGLYLIFQSLDGAVVRRREEIGVLRSLGVTQNAILRAWLLEAALLGLLGGLVGALLGWAGAQIAVRFVGRTVNALYYATSVNSARLDAGELLLALALAVAASLVAGWWPAWQAAQTPPAQILSRNAESQSRRRWWQSGWCGAALLFLAFALVWLPPWRLDGALRIPLGGYAAALALIGGAGILCSRALPLLAQAVRGAGRNSFTARIAISHLRYAASRHRLAAAGLLCAMTMAAGMLILVASFEATMRGWIANTFQADLFLTSDGAQNASTQNRIPPATWRRLLAQPGVGDANVMQTAQIRLGNLPTMLVGVDMDFSRKHPNLTWREAPLDDTIFDFARNAELGWVSESFGDRFNVRRGDVIKIPTPAGERRIVIAGVFSDYGNERGSLVVDRRHFAEWFGDELATSLILFVQPGERPETVQQRLAAEFPGLSVLTNRHLRGEILRIFRQTFSVTYALELIGILVAVIGLGMTLSSILLDRRAELTTLRALGWGRRELARATAIEGGLLAVAGVLAGTAASLGLGWILIYVINKQSFGWTLQFEVPWLPLAGLGALVIAAGTAVAWFVGLRGSGLKADREE